MVVDHVEDHAQALAVTGVDQPLQPVRATVEVVRGVQVHAVVAPPPPARVLGHGQQLDRGHPQLDEVVQLGDHPLVGLVRRERVDVQLVDREPV